MTLGTRLKLLLQVYGNTQKQLAFFVGVSEGVVSRWITGMRQPHLKYIPIICAFFGISCEILLGQVRIVDDLLIRYDEGLIK